MNYGLYISATGVLASIYRQDVIANNLANVNTTGFKRDLVTFKQRDAVRQEDGLSFMDSNAMLEKLGGGVHVGKTRIDFGQGPLEASNSDFDFAIQNNGFFVVRMDGDSRGEHFAFTRDGRMTLDTRNRLVLATNGKPVLDVNDRPIVLDPTYDISVQADGGIMQNGKMVAMIQLADFPDHTQLHKQGHGLFTASENALNNRKPAEGTIRQGFLEQSTVDPIVSMMEIADAGRMAQANANMMRYHDQMIQRAASTLGRVV